MKTFPGFAFAIVLALFVPQFSRAAAAPGADNPLGPAGEYNGSITTGGSYDPYTGNAKRVVDDLTVTGSLGAYPLKWSRVLNTRNPSPWTHNYQWGLWVKPWEYYHQYPQLDEGPGGQVTYPDGRIMTLDLAAQPYGYDEAMGASEIEDRVVYTGNGNFDLVMGDGGKVKFEHVGTITGGNAYWLIATQIIDPYGLVTTLTRDGSGRLWKITEPGGRYLQINYTNGYWTSVQAYSASGQLIETVSYTWQNNNLTQVNYDDTTHATYTYGASNVGEITGLLIRTCDDMRFAGPMKKIEYEYMPAGGPYQVAFGQIKKEKNFTTHQTVSEVTYPQNPGVPIPDSHFQRTETRGDGRTRLFQYSNDGLAQLKSYTDFKNQTTQIAYPSTETPWSSYRKSVTDARLNTTSEDMSYNAGAVTKITLPSTSPGPTPTIEFTYSDPGNPYYMTARKDENGDWTYYERDACNRVKKITYPDQSTEEFTYNNFAQVLTHKLRSGGSETFEYDNLPPTVPATRGLKTSETNAVGKTTTYQYYSSGPNTDRLWKVTDPRSNTTTFEYNQRGQVTKVIHQDTFYTQSQYNEDGTLAWTADENHPGAATDPNQRTRYTYDEYKRVLTVTNPAGETTTNCYALDPDWADPSLRKPLLHTTNCVKYTISPMDNNVIYEYDANFRKTYQGVALNTVDAAATGFEYDEVGNLTKTTDPRGNVTSFGYDQRNRKIWMDDPISIDRNSTGHTMNWVYDGVGNKLKETRANEAFRSWDYDSMSRL
jgi:YD repeat-containing protein